MAPEMFVSDSVFPENNIQHAGLYFERWFVRTSRIIDSRLGSKNHTKFVIERRVYAVSVSDKPNSAASTFIYL